jgi:hypothetical protein
MSKSDIKFDTDDKVNIAMKALKITGMVILGIGAAFLFGLVIMWLWNWLMPLIFGLPEVTYWQGIGLLILSSILFGRLGGGSSDSKKKDKGRNPIKEEIKEQIRKEMAKEFEKEREKESKESNSGYEKTYDEWWEAEGKQSFEEYAKKNEEE